MQLYLEATLRIMAEKLGSEQKIHDLIKSGEIKKTESGVIYLKIIDK